MIKGYLVNPFVKQFLILRAVLWGAGHSDVIEHIFVAHDVIVEEVSIVSVLKYVAKGYIFPASLYFSSTF